MRLDATAHEDLSKYYPDEMEHNSDLWYFSYQQFTGASNKVQSSTRIKSME